MVVLGLVDLDPDLAALRPLGGFFALRTSASPPGSLPTLAQVYAHAAPDVQSHPQSDPLSPQSDSLAFRVRKVAAALRAPEPRIAASVAHQALAARLWSAALGCAALYGRVPDLHPRLLHWDADASAPDDLFLSETRPLPAAAATIADTVLHGHLVPLTAALRTRYRVAAGLLWGNAASALAGAARELDRWARIHGRTDTAARAHALTAELLAHPLLAGTGTLTGTAFRRRSCCLYYRVPGGGVCGDCCFTRAPRSSPPRSSP
ncbi:(2Fe-2S)-binding protein [Streptomyces sp. S.PNR 29]|uniref:(2Fe-2S)-binding protein n=1 Tax=Streptomyces sp. S.PNR 29 TaxID=2973805 RepID=UPI0025AF0EC3|nr:(2Fe-2S)-binding protein [Streptomyces sp. S.PNR 29]MDN0198688.1 (2Fe-2S)-binding protein [Streptomyces sp. S.PNR 29]